MSKKDQVVDSKGNPSSYPAGTSGADKEGGGAKGEAAAQIKGTTSNPPASEQPSNRK